MPKKPPDLIDTMKRQKEIDRLRADLKVADRECGEAHSAEQPWSRAFWAAHQTLRELPLQPEASKERRLAAYDARLRAGHAWHPYRQRYRDALRWFDAILKELKTYE